MSSNKGLWLLSPLCYSSPYLSSHPPHLIKFLARGPFPLRSHFLASLPALQPRPICLFDSWIPVPREIILLCTVSPKGIGWEGKGRVSCQVPWGRQGVMAAGEGGERGAKNLRLRGYVQGNAGDPGGAEKKPGCRGKCQGSFLGTSRIETGCGVMVGWIRSRET